MEKCIFLEGDLGDRCFFLEILSLFGSLTHKYYPHSSRHQNWVLVNLGSVNDGLNKTDGMSPYFG